MPSSAEARSQPRSIGVHESHSTAIPAVAVIAEGGRFNWSHNTVTDLNVPVLPFRIRLDDAEAWLLAG